MSMEATIRAFVFSGMEQLSVPLTFVEDPLSRSELSSAPRPLSLADVAGTGINLASLTMASGTLAPQHLVAPPDSASASNDSAPRRVLRLRLVLRRVSLLRFGWDVALGVPGASTDGTATSSAATSPDVSLAMSSLLPLFVVEARILPAARAINSTGMTLRFGFVDVPRRPSSAGREGDAPLAHDEVTLTAVRDGGELQWLGEELENDVDETNESPLIGTTLYVTGAERPDSRTSGSLRLHAATPPSMDSLPVRCDNFGRSFGSDTVASGVGRAAIASMCEVEPPSMHRVTLRDDVGRALQLWARREVHGGCCVTFRLLADFVVVNRLPVSVQVTEDAPRKPKRVAVHHSGQSAATLMESVLQATPAAVDRRAPAGVVLAPHGGHVALTTNDLATSLGAIGDPAVFALRFRVVSPGTGASGSVAEQDLNGSQPSAKVSCAMIGAVATLLCDQGHMRHTFLVKTSLMPQTLSTRTGTGRVTLLPMYSVRNVSTRHRATVQPIGLDDFVIPLAPGEERELVTFSARAGASPTQLAVWFDGFGKCTATLRLDTVKSTFVARVPVDATGGHRMLDVVRCKVLPAGSSRKRGGSASATETVSFACCMFTKRNASDLSSISPTPAETRDHRFTTAFDVQLGGWDCVPVIVENRTSAEVLFFQSGSSTIFACDGYSSAPFCWDLWEEEQATVNSEAAQVTTAAKKTLGGEQLVISTGGNDLTIDLFRHAGSGQAVRVGPAGGVNGTAFSFTTFDAASGKYFVTISTDRAIEAAALNQRARFVTNFTIFLRRVEVVLAADITPVHGESPVLQLIHDRDKALRASRQGAMEKKRSFVDSLNRFNTRAADLLPSHRHTGSSVEQQLQQLFLAEKDVFSLVINGVLAHHSNNGQDEVNMLRCDRIALEDITGTTRSPVVLLCYKHLLDGNSPGDEHRAASAPTTPVASGTSPRAIDRAADDAETPLEDDDVTGALEVSLHRRHAAEQHFGGSGAPGSRRVLKSLVIVREMKVSFGDVALNLQDASLKTLRDVVERHLLNTKATAPAGDALTPAEEQLTDDAGADANSQSAVASTFEQGPDDSDRDHQQTQLDRMLHAEISGRSDERYVAYFIESAQLSGMRISLTLQRRHDGRFSPFEGLLFGAHYMVPSVEEAPLHLGAITIANHHVAPGLSPLVQQVAHTYRQQLVWQAYKVIGSIESLGNPLMLVSTFSTGIKDLLVDTVTLHPLRGVTKFAKVTTRGALHSLSLIVRTGSRTVAGASLDEQWQRDREENPDTSSGVLAGTAQGIARGIAGIVMQPWQAATRGNSLAGAFSGLAAGLVGVVARPVVGLLDGVGNTAETFARQVDAGSGRSPVLAVMNAPSSVAYHAAGASPTAATSATPRNLSITESGSRLSSAHTTPISVASNAEQAATASTTEGSSGDIFSLLENVERGYLAATAGSHLFGFITHSNYETAAELCGVKVTVTSTASSVYETALVTKPDKLRLLLDHVGLKQFARYCSWSELVAITTAAQFYDFSAVSRDAKLARVFLASSHGLMSRRISERHLPPQQRVRVATVSATDRERGMHLKASLGGPREISKFVSFDCVVAVSTWRELRAAFTPDDFKERVAPRVLMMWAREIEDLIVLNELQRLQLPLQPSSAL